MNTPQSARARTIVVALAVVLVCVVVLGAVSWFRSATAPAAATSPSLRVTAAGDYSASPAAAEVLEQIGTIKPDFNIALGDLSYGDLGGEQDWCDFVISKTGEGFPFQLVAGNHESDGRNGHIDEFAACLPDRLPGSVGTYARQYYVDVPQENPVARFVFISPGLKFEDGWWDYKAGSDRYNWTEAAIDGARAESIPWVVVAMHTPCLSLGDYQCASGPDIANLLMSKKVDLVLSGHEHFYQRTKQLSSGDGCPGITADVYDSACVRDTDNLLAKGAGTVFATVGTGGTPLRKLNPADTEAEYFAAYSALNADPSHGLIDLQFTDTALTAQFVPTRGAFADTFSIVADGANSPPVASFTNICTALSCKLDGSRSSDADGSVASYSWDFGDGTTADTAAAVRDYAAPGTYTVNLTVTDPDGATASMAQQVTIDSADELAADSFDRNVTGGWGEADLGGPWDTSGNPSAYSVSDGTSRILIPEGGASNSTYLGKVRSGETELNVTWSADKVPDGSGLYFSASGRRIVGAGEYRAKVHLSASGEIRLSLERTASNGAETIISGPARIPELTYVAGDKLSLKVQVTGTNPTLIRAKAWKAGSPEPGSWHSNVTDSTEALQVPGGIGLSSYLSRGTSNTPIVVQLEELTAAVPD